MVNKNQNPCIYPDLKEYIYLHKQDIFYRLAASLHLKEGSELTIDDHKAIGFKKDNAEKKLQDARRLELCTS